jgi:hypothetical protein
MYSLGIQLGDLVRRVLNLQRRHPSSLRDLHPAVVDEIVEVLLHECRRERVPHPLPPELDEDGFPEVPGGHTRRIEGLDLLQHLLGFRKLVRSKEDLGLQPLRLPLLLVLDALETLPRHFPDLIKPCVHSIQHLLQ